MISEKRFNCLPNIYPPIQIAPESMSLHPVANSPKLLFSFHLTHKNSL